MSYTLNPDNARSLIEAIILSKLPRFYVRERRSKAHDLVDAIWPTVVDTIMVLADSAIRDNKSTIPPSSWADPLTGRTYYCLGWKENPDAN